MKTTEVKSLAAIFDQKKKREKRKEGKRTLKMNGVLLFLHFWLIISQFIHINPKLYCMIAYEIWMEIGWKSQLLSSFKT